MSLGDGDSFSSPGDKNNIFRENLATNTYSEFSRILVFLFPGDEKLSPSPRDMMEIR